MDANNKLIARAYIMGQFGMLQCAANFSNGYGGKTCRTCGVMDDECHRINNCKEWRSINLFDDENKIDFKRIYSEVESESIVVVQKIITMWDLGNNRNCMKTTL